MRKLISTILLLITVYGVAYTPKTDADLPPWAPKDPEIRRDLVATFNSELEYAEVLRSGYEITNAFVLDGWVTITVKRGVLKTTIVVGKFDNIQDLTIKGGHLSATYKTKKSFGFFEFGVGAVVGAVVTSVIIGLSK